jgi:formate hydrogenlyase subunit 6/NADH:ubiquinone oxidoreductase subunit I
MVVNGIAIEELAMKRFGTMLPDITRSLFRHPATENYPAVQSDTPPRLRGALEWNPSTCTGCGLCVMDCPAYALELTVLDRKAKHFVMTYHVDRCTFCAQCVMSCRQDAIVLSSENWELASLDQSSFLTRFGDPKDVEQALANKLADDAGKND